MMKSLRLAAVALLVSSTAVFAAETKVGSLVIADAWTRATPGGAKVGAGYLSITNTGTTPDRLVSASSPIAAVTEIHEMATVDGVMRMRALPDGITIAPGATELLKPGGNHLMLMQLKSPIAEGAKIAVTLTFEKAGTTTVQLEAGKVGTSAPAGHASHGSDHGNHVSHGKTK